MRSDLRAVALVALTEFVDVSDCLVSRQNLPLCGCDAFRNGLTTDNIGEEACAKVETHGLHGSQTWCAPATEPFIPHLSEGCASDHQRVRISALHPLGHDRPRADTSTHSLATPPHLATTSPPL